MDEQLKEIHASQDWSNLEGYEATITCSCGMLFRGIAKCVSFNGGLILLGKNPCPNCGTYTKFSKVSSDPESYSIG